MEMTKKWLEMDSSLRNSCMKCNKGGDLLKCGSKKCPIVVHRSCVALACPVSIVEEGRFCCPYCMCQKAEAELRLAKENFLSRMKDLSAFLSAKPGEMNEEAIDASSKPKDLEKLESVGIREAEDVQRDEVGTAAASRESTEKVNGTSSSSSEDEALVTPKRRSSRRSAALAKEKISNDKFDSPTSPEQPRLRTPTLDDDIFSSRRSKRVRWGPEEVEMLKEGFERFSRANRNIPWRKILEYGHDVFNENRTPSDLKEKWKNLSKLQTP